MRRSCSIAILSALFLCHARFAAGQVAGGLDLGGGVARVGAGGWQRESQLSPMLRVSSRFGFVALETSVIERAGLFSFQRSKLEAAVSPPATGMFRLNFAGHLARHSPELDQRDQALSLTSTLSSRFGPTGFWLGTGYNARVSGDTSVEPVHLTAGGWRSVGGAMFTLSTRTHQARLGGRASTTREEVIDSVFVGDSLGGGRYVPVWGTFGDSGSASRLRSWSDVEFRADWSVGRVMLVAAVSGRPAIDSIPGIMWGRIAGVFRITRRISLAGSIGRLPTQFKGGLGAAGSGNDLTTRDLLNDSRMHTSRFATLGLRLAPMSVAREPLPSPVRPAANSFAVRRVQTGEYRIVIRVPSARSVELSGDFNNWKPVALQETAPNVWEGTFSLAPGTYRMNVRVDGDSWTAPHGVPSVEDEFNGRVGLVVIR